MARSLTEWENVDHPLSGCKATLNGVHGFVRTVKYRMIRGVDTQSICDFQGKGVRQAFWASQRLGVFSTYGRNGTYNLPCSL